MLYNVYGWINKKNICSKLEIYVNQQTWHQVM